MSKNSISESSYVDWRYDKSSHGKNSQHNYKMAKFQTKPKSSRWDHKSEYKYSLLRRLNLVKPDEVIERLKSLGVSMSRKTLYNYEKKGLIPDPEFRNSRTTELPDHTHADAYASHTLIHKMKLSPEEVAQIRQEAINNNKERLWEQVSANNPELLLPLNWLLLKNEVLNKEKGVQEDQPYLIYISPKAKVGDDPNDSKMILFEKIPKRSDEAGVPHPVYEDEEPEKYKKLYSIWEKISK